MTVLQLTITFDWQYKHKMVSDCTCYSVSAGHMPCFFCVCHRAFLSDIQYMTTLLDKDVFIQKFLKKIYLFFVFCHGNINMCVVILD